MTLDKSIRETVAEAKEQALLAITEFMKTGEMPGQTKEEADLIIEQHKWLQVHCTRVQVSSQGMRKRMGWTAESLQAMKMAFQ